MYILTPAMCWCQYFYKIYPEDRTATFLSIKNANNRLYITSSKFCDIWECGRISEFDDFGSLNWTIELPHNDVGSATLGINNDTIYVGGNYYKGLGKSIINRITLKGKFIDETIFEDPLKRFIGTISDDLNVSGNYIFLSSQGKLTDSNKAMIYSITKNMKLHSIYVDTTQDLSVVWDANIGPDSLLTCFIMETGIATPRDRRRIEKYDQDLNLVWKYQPPDSLLFLGNDVKLYGTVLDNGNIFFTYYKFGWNDRLPQFQCIDTITKKSLWEYNFQNISSHERYVVRTKQLKNGDILLSGQYATKATTPRINRSPWLMKLDRNGNRKWERAFVELGSNGQDKTGALWDAIELDNGDIMACGFVRDENQKWDPLLIRTDADGCIDQGTTNCPQVQIIDLMSGTVNPSYEGNITVDIPNYDNTVKYSYSVQSASGGCINKGTLSHKVSELSLNIPSGLYFVTLLKNGKPMLNQKWVVIR